MNHPHHQEQDERAQRIAYLIAGYIQHTLTPAEHDELDAWVEASDENMKMFEDLTDEKNIRENLEWMQKTDTEARLRQVKEQLQFSPPAKKRSKTLYSLLAVAAVLIFVAVALYIVYNEPNDQPTVALNEANEILPSANATTLTLSNGKTIALQSANPGSVAAENDVQLDLTAEGLQYAGRQHQAGVLHTLSTSTGGNFSLVLSDGTKVWLNAASALKYPVSFGAATREVELTGEAYFEVSKGTQPFIVRLANGESVEVLGTQFNISAYNNEPVRTVTLVEGKVKVANAKGSMLLQPGQQSIIVDDKPQLSAKFSVDQAIAWKNQVFSFRDAGIQTIMRQLQRWYDIKIVYTRTPVEMFNANISKKEPLSKILHLLQQTGKVRFKTENNTVYVL